MSPGLEVADVDFAGDVVVGREDDDPHLLKKKPPLS